MNILDRLDMINEQEKVVNEAGIRNMKTLAKEYKKAEIYFHIDLDGVTSAIGMRKYLEGYGIKTVDAHPMQYGDIEYKAPKPQNKTLAVMVDFAHGKPTMKIHTDHHDAQVGVTKGTSTAFSHVPSNAAYISQVLSPNDLFPPKDAHWINTIDSADFASQGIEPDDIMRAVFGVNKKLSPAKNHRMMAFAANKLLLAYKNKPDFLKQIVMRAKPSLMSLYNEVVRLAKKEGYKSPAEVETGTFEYADTQADIGLGTGKPSDVKKLKSGQSVMIGTTIVQYGGGSMIKGFDRYTPFKNNPDADFYTIVWPMGLIQLSKNPFKRGKNPYHLGDLVMKKVMPKFKSKLSKDVTLGTIKWMFERDKNFQAGKAMGFTFEDFIALFDKQIKNLAPKGKYRDMVRDITNKPNKYLSAKQKAILNKVTISVWDLVMAQSGGHPSITNISGLNFMGKGYVDLMKEIQTEIAKVMQDKRLKEE